jgi:hypothetical protein
MGFGVSIPRIRRHQPADLALMFAAYVLGLTLIGLATL